MSGKSYIGVTGFTSLIDASMALDCLPKEETTRLLQIGALVSYKTLMGMPNKYPNRYPNVDQIAGIFPASDRALNLIHYHTEDIKDLFEQLELLVEAGGKNFHGFQLNIVWPPPDALQAFRDEFPSKRIALQINNRALEMVGKSPEQLANKLATEYKFLIDDILLDGSGGRGVPLAHDKVRPYLEAIRARGLDFGLGAAGGLGPDTFGLIAPLLKDFPDLNFDAESELRDNNDCLAMRRVEEYISGAFAMCAPPSFHEPTE